MNCRALLAARNCTAVIPSNRAAPEIAGTIETVQGALRARKRSTAQSGAALRHCDGRTRLNSPRWWRPSGSVHSPARQHKVCPFRRNVPQRRNLGARQVRVGAVRTIADEVRASSHRPDSANPAGENDASVDVSRLRQDPAGVIESRKRSAAHTRRCALRAQSKRARARTTR